MTNSRSAVSYPRAELVFEPFGSAAPRAASVHSAKVRVDSVAVVRSLTDMGWIAATGSSTSMRATFRPQIDPTTVKQAAPPRGVPR
jgi:hypothetical protein